jgi:hypothetical protein
MSVRIGAVPSVGGITLGIEVRPDASMWRR